MIVKINKQKVATFISDLGSQEMLRNNLPQDKKVMKFLREIQ